VCLCIYETFKIPEEVDFVVTALRVRVSSDLCGIIGAELEVVPDKTTGCWTIVIVPGFGWRGARRKAPA
jgi:hypothetical protein